MKEKLKIVGGGMIGIAFFIGLIFLAVFFLKGGLWLSIKLLPLFSKISAIIFLIFCIVLLPLAIFKKTRGVSGLGMVFSSNIFGATLWMWAFLLCFSIWGWRAIIFGLLIAGVGVVPIALLATALKGMWSVFGQLIVLVIIVFAVRIIGGILVEKAE